MLSESRIKKILIVAIYPAPYRVELINSISEYYQTDVFFEFSKGDFRDEKCVNRAASEHESDGIAGGKRVYLLEQPAKKRRKNEQEACCVMAPRVYVFRACDSVCGE